MTHNGDEGCLIDMQIDAVESRDFNVSDPIPLGDFIQINPRPFMPDPSINNTRVDSADDRILAHRSTLAHDTPRF